MAKLVYSTITSLDGYTVDADGRFDWATPDDDVHAAVNDLERSIGTYLYGRRMYEVMAAWETVPTAGELTITGDYAAIWRAADKIVYSRTLQQVSSARTRVERDFDPAAVRELVAAAPADVSIGGPHLAAEAIRAGLVDECRLFVVPVAVGGGTPAFPRGVRLP